MPTYQEILTVELTTHLLEAMTDKPSPEVKRSIARGKHFVNVISKDVSSEIDNSMKADRK